MPKKTLPEPVRRQFGSRAAVLQATMFYRREKTRALRAGGVGVEAGVAEPPNSPAAWWDLSDASRMTLTGDSVDQADDQVGSNHLTGVTTTRPDFFASKDYGLSGRVRYTNHFLSFPAGLALDNSQLSIFVVCHAVSAEPGSQPRGTLFHAPEASTNIALYIWDDGVLFAWDGAGRSSGFTMGSCVQTAWMIGGAANSWIGLDAQTLARGSAFTAKTASGGRVGRWASTSFPLSGDELAVVVYDKALSLAEKDEVLNWANANYGAPKASTDTLIVFSGDSMTEGVTDSGSNLANNDVSYPQQLQMLHPSNTFRPANIGDGGALITNNTAAADEARHLSAGSSYATRLVLGLWGHNDANSARTAAQIKADLDTWIASIRAADAGAQVALCTILNSTGFSGAEQDVVDEVNTYIRDGVSGPDIEFHIDTQAIADLSDPADTEFFVDGVHPTEAGYAAMAAGVDAELITQGILTSG